MSWFRLKSQSALRLLCALASSLAMFVEGASVVINEAVANNDQGHLDEDGDRPDWIELLNTSPTSVNLSGWGMSDDPDTPFKWRFPSRLLAAGKHVLVFASGKNRTNRLQLHLNFKLRAEGERVLLTRPDGVREDDWSAILIPRNYSYGRKPDGSSSFGFFSVPTPATSNLTTALPVFAASPVFSSPGGFYNSGFELTLATPDPEAQIRYTLDGSEPTGSSTVYVTPIPVRDRSPDANGISMYPGTATVNQHTDGWFPPSGLVTKGTVVRAKAFRPGAWPSPVATCSYLVFSNASQRYSLPVVSLAVNTNHFFNFTTGIYVLGKVFSDYTNSHPGEFLTGHTPANYTQRGDFWERPAHLEYLEIGGSTGFSQNVVLDIQGQSSRSFRQKTLGVKSRNDAQPIGAIDYPLWPGLRDRSGRWVPEFSNLRLANSGNDWNETMFRDSLCHRLCAPTGIDTLAYRPLIVFLNGEYWGIHNAREQLDPLYFERHYQVPREDVVICETIGSLVDGRPGDEQHFFQMRAFIETNDMAVATNYAWVQRRMDVKNFIAYQASQIYIANADWPHNNIRFWRKRTVDYETNAPLGHDGRWRWAMFDTDLAYAHSWSGGFGDNTLATALSPTGRPGVNAPWSTLIFRRLMMNPEFRREFINTFADHLNSSFRESRADITVAQMQATIASSMAEHIRRWRSIGGSMAGWSNNVRVMRTFATQRPINCRQHLTTQLGLAGTATMTFNVSHAGRGRLRVNTLLLDSDTPGVTNLSAYPWRGIYFRGVPIELEALPYPGYMFAGWSNRVDLGVQSRITVSPTNNVVWTALFERLPAHDLATSPYVFSSWNPDAPPGSAPLHMRFEQTDMPDPELGTGMTGEWELPFNLLTRSRINGLGEDGVAFINTSSVQPLPGAGYPGAAVIALRTLGIPDVEVSWTGGTVLPNQQPYGFRLQYSVGEGSFVDAYDDQGGVIEYLRSPAPGHFQVMGPWRLPASVGNQAYVQLRWKFYRTQPGDGPRAQLRLDDILVRAAGSPPAAILEKLDISPDQSSLLVRLKGGIRTRYHIEASEGLVVWMPLGELITDLSGRGESTHALNLRHRFLFLRAVAR